MVSLGDVFRFPKEQKGLHVKSVVTTSVWNAAAQLLHLQNQQEVFQIQRIHAAVTQKVSEKQCKSL